MLSIRSSTVLEWWLKTAYWTTFLMSWLGVPLMLKWWGWQIAPDDIILAMTQIAFIGAVCYPMVAISMWFRGTWLEPVQWNCVLGSALVAVVFGVWVSDQLSWSTIFLILGATLAFVSSVTAVRAYRAAM